MISVTARGKHASSGAGLWSSWPLPVIILCAIILRLGAVVVLRPTLESDPLAYFTMAKSLVEHGVLSDNFGQHAFYSAGYPLALAPFFWLFGSSIPVALSVNMLLAAVTLLLVDRLARVVTGRSEVALLAAAAVAVWLPSIWSATLLAKENLSTPLLLGFALCAVRIARGERLLLHAVLGGLAWGAGLVTGGSSLLLALGVALPLLTMARLDFRRAFTAASCFAIGAALVLGPWFYSTYRMVGTPVLTTNAAFNLYLGNNPAATGRFVSIADTPLGPGWNPTRIALGEIRNARRLQEKAHDWIVANKARAAQLGALKLAYFWEPNIPDSTDFAESKSVAGIRLIEVAQYLLIIGLALWGFRSNDVDRRAKHVLAAMILGFWLLHAAAYIIPRYRDPVVPLLIIMAAAPVAARLRIRMNWKNEDAV